MRACASRRPCSSVSVSRSSPSRAGACFASWRSSQRQVVGDRLGDLGLGRTRADDELGREALPDDDAVTLDALRAAYVQLDHTAADLDQAHGWTVGVVPDGNACDRAGHAPCPSRPPVPPPPTGRVPGTVPGTSSGAGPGPSTRCLATGLVSARRVLQRHALNNSRSDADRGPGRRPVDRSYHFGNARLATGLVSTRPPLPRVDAGRRASPRPSGAGRSTRCGRRSRTSSRRLRSGRAGRAPRSGRSRDRSPGRRPRS